jgi:hypothetical protein
LKNRLGRGRFKAYDENRWIQAAAAAATFAFVTSSFCVFANSVDDILAIFSGLRWS